MTRQVREILSPSPMEANSPPSGTPDNRKRPIVESTENDDAQRPRLDPDAAVPVATPRRQADEPRYRATCDPYWHGWLQKEVETVVAYYSVPLNTTVYEPNRSTLSETEIYALINDGLKRLVERDIATVPTSLNESRYEQWNAWRERQTQEATIPSPPKVVAPQVEAVALTEEQQVLFDLVQKGKSLFITGRAGSGKSVLVDQIYRDCQRRKKSCALTTPTDISATNTGGISIHRWSGLGPFPGNIKKSIDRLSSLPEAADRWKNTDLLIIDEANQMTASTFDKFEKIARHIRAHPHDFGTDSTPSTSKSSNKYVPSEPGFRNPAFGGMQVVCVGDFFQLLPVETNKQQKGAQKSKEGNNRKPTDVDFLFQSQTFRHVFRDHTLRLTLSKRQAEGSKFSEMLELLRKYRGSAGETAALNEYFCGFIGEHKEGQEAVHLKTSSKSKTNTAQLRLLNGPEVSFFAQDYRNTADFELPIIDNNMNEIAAKKVLHLKPGAPVMYLNKNGTLVEEHLGQIAFLMTKDLFDEYHCDFDELFPLYQHFSSSDGISEADVKEMPDGIEEIVGKPPRRQWDYYRNALTRIDQSYRREAHTQNTILGGLQKLHEHAQSNKDPAMQGQAKKKRIVELKEELASHLNNTSLRVVITLASDQFFLVPRCKFEKAMPLQPKSSEEQDSNASRRVICTRKQLPLTLSSALSLHRAQGHTLLRTVVDTRDLTTSGEVYLALSRVRDPENLRLTSFHLPQPSPPAVRNFENSLKDALKYKAYSLL